MWKDRFKSGSPAGAPGVKLTRGIVKNRKALIQRGRDEAERKARRDLIDIVEDTLSAVDPSELVRRAVQLDGDTLRVGGESIDLSDVESIYVGGGGKACFPMARAVDEILGDRVRGGVLNVPEEPGTGMDER